MDRELSRTRLNAFHREIDGLREAGYYGSGKLQAQSQNLRRRQHIPSREAFGLLMFAAFAETYNGIWEIARPAYEDVFRQKYNEITGTVFEEKLPLMLAATGVTPLGKLQIEAEYRARLVADNLSVVKNTAAGGTAGASVAVLRSKTSETRPTGIDGGGGTAVGVVNDGWDGDVAIPAVADSLAAAKNRLLRKSSKGGWIGYMDDIMALHVGYASIEIGKKLGGKYQFFAQVDERTTQACKDLHLQIIDAEDMALFVNVPPIFPPPHSCRSWIEYVGNISGARNSVPKGEGEHAKRYYPSIRKRKNDYKHIAKNTGFSEQDILAIKNYLFVDTHDFLGNNRFDLDDDIAKSWQRLIEGRNIQKHDITLLRHELMEMELIRNGMTQHEAHILASYKHNYSDEATEWRRSRGLR
jgi:hypothetical protein